MAGLLYLEVGCLARYTSDQISAGEVDEVKGTRDDYPRVDASGVVKAGPCPYGPLPCFLQAQNVGRSLMAEVEALWGDIGNLRARGVALVVDGLDLVGAERASTLVIEVRSLLRSMPRSRAMTTHRPLALRVDEGSVVAHGSCNTQSSAESDAPGTSPGLISQGQESSRS